MGDIIWVNRMTMNYYSTMINGDIIVIPQE